MNGLVLCLDAGNTKSYPGSGTVWTDLSGRGNNGTLTNGPTYSSANGGSIVFDGTNDRVTISNSLLSSTGNWTISSWVKFSALIGNASDETAASIFSQYIAVTGNGRMILRVKNNTTSIINKIDLFLGSGSDYSNQTIVGNTTILTNTYYNFVATRNSNIFTLYINSILETSQTLTGINVSILQTAPEIGGLNSGNFGFMNGQVYNTSIYNRALTAAEIQQNFNALRGRFGI
jgi:hypothetical protein